MNNLKEKLNLYAVDFGYENVFIAHVKAHNEQEAILFAHQKLKENTNWHIEDNINYHNNCILKVDDINLTQQINLLKHMKDD